MIKVSYIFSPMKNIFMRFLAYPTSNHIYNYIYIVFSIRNKSPNHLIFPIKTHKIYLPNFPLFIYFIGFTIIHKHILFIYFFQIAIVWPYFFIKSFGIICVFHKNPKLSNSWKIAVIKGGYLIELEWKQSCFLRIMNKRYLSCFWRQIWT